MWQSARSADSIHLTVAGLMVVKYVIACAEPIDDGAPYQLA